MKQKTKYVQWLIATIEPYLITGFLIIYRKPAQKIWQKYNAPITFWQVFEENLLYSVWL